MDSNVLIAANPGLFTPIVTAARTAEKGEAIAYADPVPQAVILTAIVIGFSIQALMLVAVMKLARDNPTLDCREIERKRAAMNKLTIIWIALPLFVGFSIYLLPKLSRILALGVSLVSLAYGLWYVFLSEPLTLELVDSFGVSLFVDRLGGFFILTNAVVTAAVILYCWSSSKGSFFYTQAIILHGSVNSVFICADLISVYVALEVVGIAAFLLIAYPRTERSIWVGLRYLFVSNTAMLFYLLGAALVYQANRSFAFTALENAPTAAIALIFLGLLAKGGIFISGLWLPLTHGESESPVSALLSGAVVKTGVFPLVRFALILPELDPLVRLFGVMTALLGVGFAVFAKDTKRIFSLPYRLSARLHFSRASGWRVLRADAWIG